MGDPSQDELDQHDDPILETTDPIADDAGADSFPDPVIDEEPEPSHDALPPVQAEEPNLPAVPPPPSPIPDTPAPVAFQPQAPQQADYQPTIQFYSRAQLQEAVNNGVINEDQMITQLQLQERETTKQETLRAFHEQQRVQTLASQVQEYSALVPGWDQVGTPANQRVNPEWQRLINMGFPNNEATKLLALEKAFGTSTHIKQARQVQTQTAERRAVPQAIARRGGPPASATQKDPLKALPQDELKLYKHYIEQGHYKNWDEVRQEVKYGLTQTVNTALRQRTAGLMR